MSRLARLLLAFSAVALVVACQGDRSVTPPIDRPSLDLSDGAHDGEENFFFLPPLAPDPSGHENFKAAEFNANLAPAMAVCELTGNPTSDPSATCVPGAAFVFGPEKMQMVPEDEHYHLNWDTKASNLVTTNFYRILIFSGASGGRLGKMVGFLDVDPVDGGMKNAKSDEVYQFQDDRTVPTKVRFQNGALCPADVDCVEAVARGGQNNTITTPSGRAGVFISADDLDAGEEVTVIINEHTSRPCLPADFPQRDECYDYFTDPPVRERPAGGFNNVVEVGMCVEVGDLTPEQVDALLLHKFDPAAERPVIEALPNVPVDFLSCEPPNVGGLRGVVQHLASLFRPRPLFAADAGLGGEAGSFSTIGWGLPAEISIVAGDDQEAVTGTAAPFLPAVQVTDRTGGEEEPGNPLQGLRVTFTVIDQGTVAQTEVFTDEKGIAATRWILGDATGANTLQASARAIFGSPLDLNARGFELSGTLTESGEDAGSDDRIEVSPDLVSATIDAARGQFTLRVRFAEGTFDPDVAAATFDLDTDQNPATGHKGVDADGTIDNGVIGSEYIVQLGTACFGGRADLKKFAGTQNVFDQVASVDVTVVTNGYDVSFPFSLLNDDGRLNFKVTTAAQISPESCGRTGILDILSDAGSAAGTLVEIVDEAIP